MNKKRYGFSTPFVALLVLVISPSYAHAYLDAGSGSSLIQLLLAGGAGAAVAFRFWWRQIKTRLRYESVEQPTKAADAD